MKKVIIIVGLILLPVLYGCDNNIVTKNFGGTSNENLPSGQKLINVTWKKDNIWVLTRPMRPDEKPETYEFSERSVFGILEGKIILKETK